MGTTPNPGPSSRIRWYDLSWVVPYRDLVLVIGFGCFLTGVFLIPKWGLQAGLILLGVGLIVAAWRVLQS
jgi:hypothetical protein